MRATASGHLSQGAGAVSRQAAPVPSGRADIHYIHYFKERCVGACCHPSGHGAEPDFLHTRLESVPVVPAKLEFFFSKPISVPFSCAACPFSGKLYTATVNEKRREKAFSVIASAPPRRGRGADRSDISSSPQWNRLDWRLGSWAPIRAL
jgi:hypothetical protein